MQENHWPRELVFRASGLAGVGGDEVTGARPTSHRTSVARLQVVAVAPVDAVNTCTETRKRIVNGN